MTSVPSPSASASALASALALVSAVSPRAYWHSLAYQARAGSSITEALSSLSSLLELWGTPSRGSLSRSTVISGWSRSGKLRLMYAEA